MARIKSQGNICHDRKFHGSIISSQASRIYDVKGKDKKIGNLFGRLCEVDLDSLKQSLKAG